MRATIAHKWDEEVLQLIGPGERVLSTFNFSKLQLTGFQTKVISTAFVPVVGHTSLESQRQTWRSIRKLSACVRTRDEGSSRGFDKTVLRDFAEFLRSDGISATTCQSHYNAVKKILEWGCRNHPSAFSNGIDIVARPFTRTIPQSRKYLSETQQRLVLRACYEAIEETESRLKSAFHSTRENSADMPNVALYELAEQLLQIGGGIMPSQKTIESAGNNLRRKVAEMGGLRKICRHLWVTPEAMFPFYLSILIQTSGNPMAVKAMTTSCIRPHPLREDIDRIVWEKPRARAEQIADFPREKRNSASNLVRRYLDLAANLRHACPESEKNYLFICLRTNDRKVAVPCMQAMHLLLDAFIKKHKLPTFDFRDIRVSGARSHHVVGRSLEAARIRLNHRNSRTTQRYTPLEDRAVDHAKAIRNYQGQLLAMSKQYGNQEANTDEKARENPAQTVFGFGCRDPFAGIAKNSTKGKLCLQFAGCASCPGAIVVLDDVHSVARIVASHKALTNAKARALSEGWWPRYKNLYADTLRIIESDLLPRILPQIVDRATEISKNVILPHLE